MATYKFGQYSLTKPLTLNGEAYYWTALLELNNGVKHTLKDVRFTDGKHFTFQALREAKLIVTENGEFKITTRGQAYINYYSVNSNPQKSFFDRNPMNTDTIIETKESFEKRQDPNSKVIKSIIETVKHIPTTSKIYQIEVQRTNGASIYCEKYEFGTSEDRDLAINVLNRALHTTVKEI